MINSERACGLLFRSRETVSSVRFVVLETLRGVRFRALCGLSAAVLGLIGCSTQPSSFSQGGSSAADPQIVELRGRYFLNEAPIVAVAISDAKKALETAPTVVLMGRIGAGKHDPWEKGKATFVISEASTEKSGHASAPDHDADNCPFCKRRASATESTAIVQFVDDQGEVLPVDARQLLDAEKDQLVIVRGRGEVNGLGTLVVSVQGIYVKR